MLDEMENDDTTILQLEKAMHYFCGMYDMCEGYKHALRLTINDQYKNHAHEQDADDMEKLKAILTK